MSSSRCVVLVDDSADDIVFVRRALASSHPDAEFLAVRSGSEALERLLDQEAGPRAGLVLLDLKLPGLGGHDILKSLRARFTPGELPVVIFTSSREPSDIRRAYAAGANSYVVKPLVYEEYAATVSLVSRYWLDLNVSLDPGGAHA